MDLTLTDSEAAFRDEVRSWLEENHPGPAPEGDDAAEFGLTPSAGQRLATVPTDTGDDPYLFGG